MQLIEVLGLKILTEVGEDGALIPLCSEPTLSIVLREIKAERFTRLDLPAVDDTLPAPPDWQGWQVSLLTNPKILAGFNQVPTILVSTLTTLLGQLSTHPETLSTIVTLWQSIANMLPQDARDDIKKACELHRIPAELSEVV